MDTKINFVVNYKSWTLKFDKFSPFQNVISNKPPPNPPNLHPPSSCPEHHDALRTKIDMWLPLKNRSSRSQIFFNIGILKNFTNFSRKRLYWNTCILSRFLTQVSWIHRYFPVKFAKFLRTPILKTVCKRLVLLVDTFHFLFSKYKPFKPYTGSSWPKFRKGSSNFLRSSYDLNFFLLTTFTTFENTKRFSFTCSANRIGSLISN